MSQPPHKPAVLSAAEWEIMNILWDKGPLAARAVYDARPEARGWAYNTVKTMLSRLVAKGALRFEQIGNSYLYSPLASREQVTHREVQGFVKRVLHNVAPQLFAEFIESQPLTRDDIDSLRRLLDAKERQGKCISRKGKK